jgi:hypothetical protein
MTDTLKYRIKRTHYFSGKPIPKMSGYTWFGGFGPWYGRYGWYVQRGLGDRMTKEQAESVVARLPGEKKWFKIMPITD